VNDASKVLIVGPSWVGDMVMAQSLYQLLKSTNPETEIHVLAPPWSRPVLERMDQVTRAVELPAAHGELALRRRYELGRRLRAERYARAIVLPRSFKAALLPFFARIPIRTGYRGEHRYGVINDMRRLDPVVLDQTVKRFVALGPTREGTPLSPLAEPRLRTDETSLAQAKRRLKLPAAAEVVAMMPGAEYGDAKRWPLESYADLARRLANVGVDVWILGSEKERPLGQAIAESANRENVRNLCGRTTLGDVVDLLGAAKVAVTNDSGLMHVAAAVRTHVVALYGSTSPAMTPPLTSSKSVFHLALECSPCFQRECPLGHLRCLRDIAVDDVLSRVITALGDPGAGVRGSAHGRGIASGTTDRP
jgi:heptosyltransferase-2